METKDTEGKSYTYYMRILHRDIGFLVLGLTVVYALSGIVLIYRETDFLKSSVQVDTSMPPHMSSDDLSKKLRARRFEVTQIDGEVIHFKDGTAIQDGIYDGSTGAVRYVEKKLPDMLQRLIRLHKVSTSKAAHGFAVAYGVMLLFLALSSLGMFKPASRQFRRGIVLSLIGIGLAIGILLMV